MEIDRRQFRRSVHAASITPGHDPSTRMDSGCGRLAPRMSAVWLALALASSAGLAAPGQAFPDVVPLAETGKSPSDAEIHSSHLSLLFGEFEGLETLRREIRTHCGEARAGLNWQADGMGEFADKIKQSLDRLSDIELGQASLVELFELDRRIGYHRTDLDRVSDRLTEAAAQLEDDHDRLERELKRWNSARLAARERAAPAELSSRIDGALAQRTRPTRGRRTRRTGG